MKILEIVHLQMAGESLEDLAKEIRKASERWEGSARVHLYRHGRLDSDLMVHLHRTVPDGAPSASDLGTHVASVLRIHGIVHHSVWMEAD